MGVVDKSAGAFSGLLHLERKHRIIELDKTCRELIEFVALRELDGVTSTADDMFSACDSSKATVYRKIRTLVGNGAFVEAWTDQQLTYSIGINIHAFCEDLSAQPLANLNNALL